MWSHAISAEVTAENQTLDGTLVAFWKQKIHKKSICRRLLPTNAKKLACYQLVTWWTYSKEIKDVLFY